MNAGGVVGSASSACVVVACRRGRWAEEGLYVCWRHAARLCCSKLRLPARAGIAGAPSDQPEGKDGGMGKTLPAVVRGAQSPAVAAPSVSAVVAAGLRWFTPHSGVGPR